MEDKKITWPSDKLRWISSLRLHACAIMWLAKTAHPRKDWWCDSLRLLTLAKMWLAGTAHPSWDGLAKIAHSLYRVFVVSFSFHWSLITLQQEWSLCVELFLSYLSFWIISIFRASACKESRVDGDHTFTTNKTRWPKWIWLQGRIAVCNLWAVSVVTVHSGNVFAK